MTAEIIKLKPTRPCPICGRPSSQQFHPFCSGRCQDIDLNRWLSGSYVIPADDDEDVEEDGVVTRDDGDEQ
ncbi:DNA gyrase inhibitor YacG [Devosia sp. A16]|uniref:DNA gyrase inhibitor YacG n=1 Tax=Devosia sp. A16 TaxID=1736675 RepID=UPI0006D79A7F|nr:DNA gyrase inhibitor YacG [Devosia sp. A16]